MIAGYGMIFDFIAFFMYFQRYLTIIHVRLVVSSPNIHKLYVWQIYTFWYYKMQDRLQVKERSLVLLRFFGTCTYNWRLFMPEVLYLYKNYTDCVYNKTWHIGPIYKVKYKYKFSKNFLKFSKNLRGQKWIKFQNIEENSKISTKSHFLFDSTWHIGPIYKAKYKYW